MRVTGFPEAPGLSKVPIWPLKETSDSARMMLEEKALPLVREQSEQWHPIWAVRVQRVEEGRGK